MSSRLGGAILPGCTGCAGLVAMMGRRLQLRPGQGDGESRYVAVAGGRGRGRRRAREGYPRTADRRGCAMVMEEVDSADGMEDRVREDAEAPWSTFTAGSRWRSRGRRGDGSRRAATQGDDPRAGERLRRPVYRGHSVGKTEDNVGWRRAPGEITPDASGGEGMSGRCVGKVVIGSNGRLLVGDGSVRQKVQQVAWTKANAARGQEVPHSRLQRPLTACT